MLLKVITALVSSEYMHNGSSILRSPDLRKKKLCDRHEELIKTIITGCNVCVITDETMDVLGGLPLAIIICYICCATFTSLYHGIKI